MSEGAKPQQKIVFDFAGVLFHWVPTALMQRELPRHATDKASAEHWVAHFFQSYSGDWAEFDRGTVEPEALVRRIAARTGLAEAEVWRVVNAIPLELSPMPDSVALVRALHAAGRPLHFLSNMPGPYARHLSATHEFLRCFQSGLYSADVKLIKPEPAIFELAAKHFDAAPQDLLFLDDHAENVRVARSLGWDAVHFTSAAGAAQALRERGHLA